MASKIRLLDELPINKIAAGEVIENPASVVKELLENSLDAGSTEIAIEVMNGGRTLIRISDNGSGMGKDDALLSLERHATSKIKSIDDFNCLNTLGFRGEAIPSIASISKYSCLTSDGIEGTLVKVLGGKLNACDAAVREKGTTIEVKDLFFNVPVRRKFQRSPHFDEQEILRMVSLHAIARPDIKFRLIINQKPVLHTHSDTLFERIGEVLGIDFQKELIPIEKEGIFGFITKPFFHKSNKAQQTLFLNNRPVQSSFISFAMKEAYSTHIPQNRYPGYVLFIHYDHSDIDVNVHPQKKEVRLRQESDLKRLLFLAVQEALAKRNTPIAFSEVVREPLPWDLSWSKFEPKEIVPQKEEYRFELPLKPLAQLLTTIKGYLVVEGLNQDGISLIDQSRAHARILFEKLEKKTQPEWERETLLIPLLFEFNPIDALKVKERIEDLKSVGIELREFAPRTFACDSYAVHFKPDEIETFIREFIEEEKGDDLRLRLSEKASQACVSQESVLTREMGQKLLNDLMNCQNTELAPSGKPICIHLNKDNLTKLSK
ncbi:MAG: DNA mismatch repair endonuclease MutL [Parachlamydiaceae bacterium]